MKFNIKHLEYDIAIIGAGGAGLMAGYQSIKNNHKTAIISKVFPTHSHTVAAKGGINAVFKDREYGDDWKYHFYDTIKGGDWLSDQDSVYDMCKNAANTIAELENIGVNFSRDKNGQIAQKIYGGQVTNYGEGDLVPRACYVDDRTGHSILHSLYQSCLKSGANFYDNHFALDILLSEDKSRIIGVLVLDMEQGELLFIKAKIVIIATGGYGQVYKINTSSSICTGDGNAMIMRAGLSLQDMEFIQFHPTGLYDSGFLVTEAARAIGGYLTNCDGDRFLQKYAPKYLELASRDVIARAMVSEIIEGRGCGDKKDYLHFHLEHINKQILEEKLPELINLAKKFAKIDITKEPLKVIPSVHYTMGGIPTNAKCQIFKGFSDNQDSPAHPKKELYIDNFMAIGEAACASVHGANRLGCNSLLDLVVFAKIAINNAGDIIGKLNHNNMSEQENDNLKNLVDEFYSIFSSEKTTQEFKKIDNIKMEIKEIMSKYFGIIRTHNNMSIGISLLEELRTKLTNYKLSNNGLIYNEELTNLLEYKNLYIQALATAYLAIKRQESRGSHFRSDYSKRDDINYLHHNIISINQNNQINIEDKMVRKIDLTYQDVDKNLVDILMPRNRDY